MLLNLSEQTGTLISNTALLLEGWGGENEFFSDGVKSQHDNISENKGDGNLLAPKISRSPGARKLFKDRLRFSEFDSEQFERFFGKLKLWKGVTEDKENRSRVAKWQFSRYKLGTSVSTFWYYCIIYHKSN